MVNGGGLVVDWLRARQPQAEIDEDFDLIDNRVIDSLHFMEFIFLLQEVTGRDITVEATSIDRFRTLRAIHSNFFQDAPSHEKTEELVL
jgi:acyl carrier protein